MHVVYILRALYSVEGDKILNKVQAIILKWWRYQFCPNICLEGLSARAGSFQVEH
jgi:hypothetical protein